MISVKERKIFEKYQVFKNVFEKKENNILNNSSSCCSCDAEYK